MILGCSEEIGMRFSNVNLDRDSDVSVSNVHWGTVDLLDVPDRMPLLGQGVQCNKGSPGKAGCEGTLIPTSQGSGELACVGELKDSRSAQASDGLLSGTEVNNSTNGVLSPECADPATMKDGTVQKSSPTVDGVNKTADEIAVVAADGEDIAPPAHLLSGDVHMPTRELGISPSELIMKSPIRTTRESMGARECNGQSILEGHKSTQTNADDGASLGAERELRFNEGENPPASCGPDGNRSLARSASFSPALHNGRDQPTSNQTDPDTHSGSLLELQSVVITNRRSHERELRDSLSTPRAACSNKKRGPSEISRDDSNDGAGDLDDADYVSESSVSSRRVKRARQAASRCAPRRPQQNKHTRRNASHPLVDKQMQAKFVMDQGCMSGLTDLETIPIRGFLTREILLSKVVYSVTFEEHKEHACLQEPGGTPQNYENEGQYKKQPCRKGPRTGKRTKSTRFLPEDDRLLIELKEERGLPWKRITEYFPGRSEGSLQVRYCTRLKRRHDARPESIYNVKDNPPCQAVACKKPRSRCGLEVAVKKSGSARELSRQRYGPPRRRHNADRYSPV